MTETSVKKGREGQSLTAPLGLFYRYMRKCHVEQSAGERSEPNGVETSPRNSLLNTHECRGYILPSATAVFLNSFKVTGPTFYH